MSFNHLQTNNMDPYCSPLNFTQKAIFFAWHLIPNDLFLILIELILSETIVFSVIFALFYNIYIK